MRQRSVIAGLVLIAVGVGYGYLTSRLPVRTLPNTPNPSFFPWINTVLLLVLSAALLIQGLALDAGNGRERYRRPGIAYAVVALVAFVAYLVVLPGLGFVVASIPFFAVMMVLFGELRPAWVAGGSVGAIVLLFVVFRYGFGVLLPRGLLSGLIQ